MAINAQRVRAHYDRVSKWYSLLCGEHIHQGYWESVGSIRGAQDQLVARLARIAQISLGAAVLDVGCGLGGSGFWH
jgi:tocopherol O-methyltransferase